MFILRRFLAFIPVALIVALIVFLMLHLSPGDPVAAIAGDSATAADIARIRAELGLDDPLPEQFVRWCMELIQGDLGRSYFLNRPVADLIADRVGPTLSLAGFTIVLTVLIAVPLGAWAAYRQGGWVDRALMGFLSWVFHSVLRAGLLLRMAFWVKAQFAAVAGLRPL